MKIDKEKAKRIYVEEKTVKKVIIKMEELLEYFELHNKNLTNKQYDNISRYRDILECITL